MREHAVRCTAGRRRKTMVDSSQTMEGVPVLDPTLDEECPFCFDRMRIEDRGGIGWLVCPNGCPTETEAPVTKPAEEEEPAVRRAAGAA
jgi:hypothetical protein